MNRSLISIPFLVLRVFSAGGAFVTGLFQTFVFAHVLSPQRFSVFILVAAIGYSLWFCDLGIVKLLFVRLRERFLCDDQIGTVAGHAGAVIVFYMSLVLAGTVLCFAFMAMRSGVSIREAAEFALFFLFVALNLVWFALRNIAVAVDRYVLFEALEGMRRVGYLVGLAAMYAGLPLIAMLIALNLLWAVVLALCIKRLVQCGALSARLSGSAARIAAFFRANKTELMRSGVFSISEIFNANYPYLIVPMLFGLGAPPIILDTTFKVFRGANASYGAACDLLVPRQTSALAERDGPTMVRATWLAVTLGGIPAAGACVLLLLAADKLFALLLGPAAKMPPQTTTILIILLLAGLAQLVAQNVLVHAGFFKEVAAISFSVAILMVGLSMLATLVHFDIVQFLEGYAVVYSWGAFTAVALMIRGPIRLAHAAAGALTDRTALN